MNWGWFPKVELHLHLDCSIGYRAASSIDPALTEERFVQDFVLNQPCSDLAEFLTKIPRSLDLMQEASHLQFVMTDLARQLAEENVAYAEIRFAPLLHTEKGLSSREVVSCVLSAMHQAQLDYSLPMRLILCTLRHFTERQSLETAHLAHEFHNQGVVGIDLAADEAGFPISAHRSAFAYARRKGINRTAHAGEALGAQSVWETLQVLQPQRIGHGVRSIEDPKLVTYLVESGIHLEICPECNILIGVFPNLAAHPVNRLFQSGVSLSINTDGRTIPQARLDRQYCELETVFSWGRKELLKTNVNAMQSAFTDPATQSNVIEKLRQAYTKPVT